MAHVRTIGIWVTLLLFLSGLVSPFVPAVQAACPMQEAMRRMHCHEEAKPAPAVPPCCIKHQVAITAPDELSSGCCCHLKAATPRPEIPAVLPIVDTVAALPTTPVLVALPQTISVSIATPFVEDENAPRGPPRILCSPRAPPLS